MAQSWMHKSLVWSLCLLIICPYWSLGQGCPEVCTCTPVEDGLEAECSDNDQLSYIPGDLPSDLTVLRMQRTNLSEVSGDNLTNLVHLQHLDLSQNILDDILDDAFVSLSSLKILNLDNNQLSNIPANVFQTASLLEEFSINDNDLNYLFSDCLLGLRSLKHLSMSGNRLFGRDLGELKHVPNLVTLDISRNRIMVMYEEHLSNNKNLIEINLEDNLIWCYCQNSWLARSVKEGVKWAANWRYSAKPPICDTPSHLLTMAGIRGYIPDLLEADFICYGDPVVDIAEPSLTVRPGDSLLLEAILSVGVPYSQWRTPSGQRIDVRDPTLQHYNLLPSESTKIEDEMHKTIAGLFIKNATVSDGGLYTVLARNPDLSARYINVTVSDHDQADSGQSVHMRTWVSGLLLSALYLLY